MNREYIEAALAALNNTLRETLVESERMSIQEWNEKIAPRLSGIVQAMEGTTITARTFILHPSALGIPEGLREKGE